MDDREYKRVCAQPDVMRRAAIRATLARLKGRRSDLAMSLASLLGGPAIPKPPGHDSGADTDYLWLDLPSEQIDDIVSELGDLEASLAESDAPAIEVSSTGTLLDLWNSAESSRPAV